jgi:hypothetical protein
MDSPLPTESRLNQQLLDRQFTSVLIYALVLLPVTLLRVFDTGFRTINALQVVLFGVLLAVFRFRRHLSLRAASLGLSFLFVADILAAIGTYGLGVTLILTCLLSGCRRLLPDSDWALSNS